MTKQHVLVPVRMPVVLRNRLVIAAADIDVTVDQLVERAIEEFLERIEA